MDYLKCYESLMIKARKRGFIDGYSEKHHVLPVAYGGSNHPSNIVVLSGREHFVAHWLLFKAFKDTYSARSYRLMCDANAMNKSRSYELAKKIYSNSMMGELNVAKRPDVRKKISESLQKYHPYRGKKRPAHGQLLKNKAFWLGSKNPFYGKGELQIGSLNHMATKIKGIDKNKTIKFWDTQVDAAKFIGVSPQAIVQAIKKQGKSKGWQLEYAI